MSIVNNPGTMSTPAGLAIAEEAQTLLTEANANTQAMIDTISAIIRAETIDDIVRATLDTIRKEFGWVYASYWTVDPVENVLVFSTGVGAGRRRVSAADADRAVPRGGGPQRAVLAAPRPGSHRRPGRAARLLPRTSGSPRRDQDGDRPADHARRPGDRHPGLLLDPVRGDLPGAAGRAADRSASSPPTRSPSWPGRAT